MLKNKIKNLFPNFESLIPSTITSLSFFSENIDLKKTFLNIKVLDHITKIEKQKVNKKLKFPLIEEEGIISIRMKILKDDINSYPNFDIHSNKNQYWIHRGEVGNCPFSNSLAVDFSAGEKNFSIKIFGNGKLQFCGCRSYEEAEELTKRILFHLKESGGIPYEAEIKKIEPQRINYHYNLGFQINIAKLKEILYENGFINGFDNLTSKIVIIIPSLVSKEHLKSKKPSIQQIEIYPSGKVNQGGSSFSEIEKKYDDLTIILSFYINDIKL